jgi:hypothetical protein
MSTSKRQPIERASEGMTYLEIAAELGVTPEAARVAVKNALGKFCARLEAVLEREGLTPEDLLSGSEHDDELWPALLARRVD